VTSKEFVVIIEQLKREKRITYIDAIVSYCEKNNIETDTVGKLISKPLKEKIEVEARNLNLLQKTGSLPI
tara:strand:- start:297 stop:506 length:210 start_codon:yes stop_codon:yes gene_type:complete